MIFAAVLAFSATVSLLDRGPVETHDPAAEQDALAPLVVSGVLLWAEADSASVGVSDAFLEAPRAQQREWLEPAYRSVGPLNVYADGEQIGWFDDRGLTTNSGGGW